MFLFLLVSSSLFYFFFNDTSLFSSRGCRRTESEKQQSRDASAQRASALSLNATQQRPVRALRTTLTPPAWNRPCTASSPPRVWRGVGSPGWPQSMALPLSARLNQEKEPNLRSAPKGELKRKNPTSKRRSSWKMTEKQNSWARKETPKILLVGQTEHQMPQLPREPRDLQPGIITSGPAVSWAHRGLSWALWPPSTKKSACGNGPSADHPRSWAETTSTMASGTAMKAFICPVLPAGTV